MNVIKVTFNKKYLKNSKYTVKTKSGIEMIYYEKSSDNDSKEFPLKFWSIVDICEKEIERSTFTFTETGKQFGADIDSLSDLEMLFSKDKYETSNSSDNC